MRTARARDIGPARRAAQEAAARAPNLTDTTAGGNPLLRLGMIGVGGRGGLWHNWHQPKGGRSIVVAGADVSADALTRFEERNGGNPFTTQDYRELLARDDVDAVAV